MNIRIAAENDLPRINELRRQVNDLHTAARPDMFKHGFPQEVQDYLYTIFQSDDRPILVAEIGGQIVAFACLAEIESSATPYRPARRFLEVDEVGVDESARRQGIGKRLFKEIRRIAKDRGYTRIELNMWDFNENALKFYESIGFTTYRRYMETNVD